VVRLTTRVCVPVIGWAVAHVAAGHTVSTNIVATKIVTPHIITTKIVPDSAVSDVTIGGWYVVLPYVVLAYASVAVRLIGPQSRTGVCYPTVPRVGVKTICLTQRLFNLRACLACAMTLLSRR
jgi:hypothetical protein